MFWHIYVVCFQPNLPWSIDHFPAGCWHWRLAWCFFCICLGLLTVGSSQVQTQKWKQLQLATNHVWNRMLDFLWQDVGKESSLLTGLCIFFGEADGDGGVWACWRLVPHRSKLQIGKSQCKLATNHVWNRMLDFFSWQEVGKESSLLTGLCIFFGEADGGTLQIICMCFLDSFGPVDGGFLTGPKIKIEKKPFF